MIVLKRLMWLIAVFGSINATSITQSSIWVDQLTGDDALGLGTVGSPYRTINRAVVRAADPSLSPPIAIKVGAGDYDWDWEDDYAPTPFPIVLPDRTCIEAADTASEDDWPPNRRGRPR